LAARRAFPNIEQAPEQNIGTSTEAKQSACKISVPIITYFYQKLNPRCLNLLPGVYYPINYPYSSKPDYKMLLADFPGT
jgi:hypothetical protein